MKNEREKLPQNIILLGDPAAGKATQAKRLVAMYRLHDFDMGREVRRPSVAKKYDYKGTTAKGILTPTGVVRSILREKIPAYGKNKGILFNGHPKMLGEAKIVAGLLKKAGRKDPIVIYLTIPVSEIIKRAHMRGRTDDSVFALKNRAAYYRNNVSAAISFFKTKYSFKRVSGLGSRDQVFSRLKKIIGNA